MCAVEFCAKNVSLYFVQRGGKENYFMTIYCAMTL